MLIIVVFLYVAQIPQIPQIYLLSHRNHGNHRDLFLTKTAKTLFESFGTACLCSAFGKNLVVSKLPPAPCQHQNASRMLTFQKEKPLRPAQEKPLLTSCYRLGYRFRWTRFFRSTSGVFLLMFVRTQCCNEGVWLWHKNLFLMTRP